MGISRNGLRKGEMPYQMSARSAGASRASGRTGEGDVSTRLPRDGRHFQNLPTLPEHLPVAYSLSLSLLFPLVSLSDYSQSVPPHFATQNPSSGTRWLARLALHFGLFFGKGNRITSTNDVFFYFPELPVRLGEVIAK